MWGILGALVTYLAARLPSVQSYVDWWTNLLYDNPVHLFLETTLILFLIYILLKRPGKKISKLEQLPPAIVEELIEEYEPEPLCQPLSKRAQQMLADSVVLGQKFGKYSKLDRHEGKVLNLVSMDFCNLGQREEVKEAALKALTKYGCGSCGPRAFYGTIDVHIFLEQDLAKFFGTEDAIVYSDASSTASSAIPAFSNRSDLLLVDDGVNDSILTGVNLSRSRALFFKHNDMEDLQRILEKIDEEDRRLQSKPQRRFIVVEGLYRNFGDIVPLDQLMMLRKKYKWRLILDESFSIGVFGRTGRGVHEHFNFSASCVDLLISSLSTSIGSVGGFCVGSREVTEHQRLSSAAYCFSASSPPFVSTAASAALKILTEDGETQLLSSLKSNVEFFLKKFQENDDNMLVVSSDNSSPLVHVRLAEKFRLAEKRSDYTEHLRVEEEAILRQICSNLCNSGYLVVTASYVCNPHQPKSIGASPRPSLPPPSIRFSISAGLELKEIEDFVTQLFAAARQTVNSTT